MSSDPNAIQKLYAEEKAKGFVNHLIGAYLPIYKSQKVWDFKPGQKPKCNVCGQKLMSIEEAWRGFQENQEEIMHGTTEQILKDIKGEKTEVEDHPMYKHVSKGRVIGCTGEKTDTLLCMSCIKDLLDLVQTGLLTDDKNIVWKVNKLQREGIFNTFKDNPHLDDNEKKNVKEIEKRVEKSQKKKITTFADLGVLQELKAKMEGQNDKEK
jgi:hypothetical protein